MFLVALTIVSLCAVNAQPVSSQQQTSGIIYIASDGSISTSTNLTVPIQQDGNLYTFTDNIENYFIVVQRDNVVIDGAGYSLASQGEVGIDVSYRNNVTVKNTKIGFSLYALYLWNCSRCTVSGNSLTYNQWAMYLIAASQCSIVDNSITTNNIGVYVESSSNNVFRNNVMENDYNLAVYGSEPEHFDNDIDVSNTVNGKKVYYLISESNQRINPTTFPDIGYLALVNCQNMTVEDLELTNNGHGIILAYTTGSTITGNSLTDNYGGLGLFASSGNFIVGNYLANNNRGLQLSNASNTNSISANNITNNGDGMFLFDSFQNTIVLNNITNNDIGIGFRESSYNMIRGNYFVNNARQFYDVSSGEASVTASVNIWGVGYPQGGNYWSDYTGADVKSGENQDQEGSDGLGDTPYVLYGNNEDKFPLMPYGSPPAISIVSPTNKTYTTTSVTLSVTVSEPTVWTKYSLDGKANVTFTEDTTLSALTYGAHSVTVYAQDTDGKTGATTTYFTIAEGSETPPTETTQLDSSLIILIAVVIVVIVAVALLYFLKIKKK
jgi:parallel beta-helix repeat protein